MNKQEQLSKWLKEYSNKNNSRKKLFDKVYNILANEKYGFKWPYDQKFFKDYIAKKSDECIILEHSLTYCDDKKLISISYYDKKLHNFGTETIVLYHLSNQFKFENDDY